MGMDRAMGRGAGALALLVLVACGPEQPAGAPEVIGGARLEGQVRVADRWTKVAPLVLHDAKMDLATRCLLLRDEAKGKGQDLPLCYDPHKRPERVITSILVEREDGMAPAMQRLTRADEGVHFVIDRTGGIYQVLDLALVARRAGLYPEGEIRIIACEKAGEDALVRALQALHPGATVTYAQPAGRTP